MPGLKPKDMSERCYRLTGKEYLSNGRWLFECDCGNEIITQAADVRRGKTRSCGCLHTEQRKTGNNRRTHGLSGSPEYSSYRAMITRCCNPEHMTFDGYGGRGIKVCDRWVTSFENFLADMGSRPPGTSLDRIDPNGNYTPENCRWVCVDVQANNKRTSRLLTVNDETKTITQWSRENGVSTGVIKYRLATGWSLEEAIFTPARRRKNH